MGQAYTDELRRAADVASRRPRMRADEVRRRVPRPGGRAGARRAHHRRSPATTTSSSWRCAAATRTPSTATASSTCCPTNVELVHGPGCPVCVIPMGRVDDAIAVAETPGVIFTSFGDMMRVPGGNGNLLEAKARGADVRFVYSPLDALQHRGRRTRTARSCSSPSGSRRPRRRRPSRCCELANSGVTNFSRLLQPRHDRPADQGDPRVARPAPRRLPRARARVDGRGQPPLPVRARRSTASRS